MILFKMAHFWILAFVIRTIFCAEENTLRDQRANLVPGAGGYGSSNMEDNYDYILDDTPPRGKILGYNSNFNACKKYLYFSKLYS